MRRLLPLLLLLALSAFADPLLPGFNPGPLFQPQGGIVTIDLGGGLFWQGPQPSPEDWDQRMAALPNPAPFIPLDAPIVDPEQLPLQAVFPPTVATPEPSTFSLVPFGLLAAALLLRARSLRH